MRDPLLTPELMGVGVRHERERAPDPITLEWLQESCARLERVLRLQYDEGALPEAWERQVSLHKPVGDTGAGLRLKSLLEHFFRVRWEGLTKRAEADDPGAAEAARALLRREPVTIELAGETVEVTGRSYSAMMEIAAHDLAGRELDEALQRCTELAGVVVAEIRMTPPLLRWGRRRTLNRRLHKLRTAYERLATEREKHRMAIYAHALTHHGGPAEDVFDEAPDWWRRADTQDDAELLTALFLAGPARVAELPEPKQKDDEDEPSQFGWASLFTFFERRASIPTGRAWDTDIGQVIAAVRSWNEPYESLED